MTPEINMASEDSNIYQSWNTLFYILGTIALCLLLSMVTLYWHASIVKDGFSYPYAPKNKFPELQFHEGIVIFLLLPWLLAFLLMFMLSPFALFRKRKVSWRALLFCIFSQVAVFLYFKFSSFLDLVLT